ncbi:MAG: DHH family phosphoesterase [Candidatus Micrarchaeota archaeon]|nr:DHH family phosphoesterase [Candidatus Micrarchaeota archaeon]
MDALTCKLRKAKEAIEAAERIKIITHHDCDGLACASILSKLLTRREKDFEMEVVKHITPGMRFDGDFDLFIFTDLGSGNLDVIPKSSIVLDHHEISGNSDCLHINPREYGMELSASVLVYLLARSFGFKDLSVPAVIGSVGDLIEPPENVVTDALQFGLEARNDLSIYGSDRPVHMALVYSFTPVIPGITGSESAAVEFLSKLGIKLKENGRWRKYSELTPDERRRLADGLVKELIASGMDPNEAFARKFFVFGRDVREISTFVNACGRLGEYDKGIKGCEGFYDENLLKRYRKKLSACLDAVRSGKVMIERRKHSYIFGGSVIPDTFLGITVSLSMKSLGIGSSVVGFCESDGWIKVSVRTTRNRRVGQLIGKICRSLNGLGGGHEFSGGGIIPLGSEREFIRSFETQDL